MPVSVVSSIDCEYASFSGNVSSISPNKITVADMNDMSLLEDRLLQKISALESQCELLAKAVNHLMDDNRYLADRYDDLLRRYAEEVETAVMRIVTQK